MQTSQQSYLNAMNLTNNNYNHNVNIKFDYLQTN